MLSGRDEPTPLFGFRRYHTFVVLVERLGSATGVVSSARETARRASCLAGNAGSGKTTPSTRQGRNHRSRSRQTSHAGEPAAEAGSRHGRLQSG